jgi:hypothetical protein
MFSGLHGEFPGLLSAFQVYIVFSITKRFSGLHGEYSGLLSAFQVYMVSILDY